MKHDSTSPIPDLIPEIQIGGGGPELAFLHANAYPPECYRRLLGAFAQDFRVRAMLQRPLWEGASASSLKSWHPLSTDFLAWLPATRTEPIIALGHSMGAIVALRAALREPARFRALVLLDPVLVTPRQILAWRLTRHLRLGHRLHAVIHRAKRRRCVFSNLEEVFSAYRRHPIFRQLDNDQLRLVIQGLVQSAEGQVKLKYSPTWEARVYAAAVWNDGDLWRGLPGLAVPTLIIRGSHSDTLTQEACSLAEAANPRIQTATIERATHLMPFEQPSQVHFLALQYLRLVLDGSARDGLSELRNAPEQSWIGMP